MANIKGTVYLITLGIVLLGSTDTIVSADETKSGQDLHDFNCLSCHDDSVYKREGRIIKSMSSLKTQIRRCETTLDLGWFDEELDKVADYLNVNYYKFK